MRMRIYILNLRRSLELVPRSPKAYAEVEAYDYELVEDFSYHPQTKLFTSSP